MKKRYRLAAMLLCGILLLMAGCSKPVKVPEVSMVESATGPEETTAAIEPTEPIQDAASLNSLRQAMIGTSQLFAVAYFGYHDTMDSDMPVDPYEVMREYTPQLCADLPFLQSISADRVIGSNGELFCIVPLDEDATVAVSKGIWDEANEEYIYEESLYYSESGDPILLLCNNTGWEPDTQVYISGPSGQVIWYPRADDNLCAMPLRNDNQDSLFLDFSSYREILLKNHRDMKGEWVMPTAEMLCGSTWQWTRFLKDGREVSYQLAFHGDTLSVKWYDGFDIEAHEYRDAPWELSYDEGFAILSVDFGQMAGILRYNLLYHEVYEQMYVAIDAVQEEMPIGWEPLYRFLTPPEVPEPEEMLGFWALEWTEVEGCREYAGQDTENISVFLNAHNSIRLTHVNNLSYMNNIYDKEVFFYEGELYSGCGNSQWAAYLGGMDGYATVYSFTLLDHDSLLMKLYWEIDDSVPMVAYKLFCRVSEYDYE